MPSTQEVKKHVEVHVTFLKLGEINTLKESYDADILLRSKWREPKLDGSQNEKPQIEKKQIDLSHYWNPEVYIDNVIGEPKRTSFIHVEYDANGQAYIVEKRRVKGTFVETMELFEFPFDVQDLSITVMSEKPVDEVELTEDPTEIHKIYKQSFIDEQEWYLYKYIASEKKELAKDRAEPSILRSALTVQCRAARRPAYFIWNSFSVTLLICVLSFVTFAVKPTLPQNRLQLTFTLVLTAVAFKFVVNQSLPKISYLTYLDRYILATLICVACVCFWHGFVTIIPDTWTDADLIALVVMAGITIIYNIQFILRIIAIDRYVLAALVCLGSVCFWHGVVTVLPPGQQQNTADLVALVLSACCYTLYNAVFCLRIVIVPYRKRRTMRKLEKEYIEKVQKQAEVRKSMKEGDLSNVTTHII